MGTNEFATNLSVWHGTWDDHVRSVQTILADLLSEQGDQLDLLVKADLMASELCPQHRSILLIMVAQMLKGLEIDGEELHNVLIGQFGRPQATLPFTSADC